MNNLNISGFIAGAERNMRSSLFPPGYMAKQTYLQSSDVFTATYGRKVWDALNNQTRFWNIIRKTQWGPTTGWRIRTDRGIGSIDPTNGNAELRGGTSRPVSETGNLPTIGRSAYRTVDSPPRIVTSMLGVTLIGQIMSGLEGGMGDNLAVEQEGRARDHIKLLNQGLLLSNNTRISAAGTFGFGTTPGTGALVNYDGTFRDGDSVATSAADATAYRIVGVQNNGAVRVDGSAAVNVGANDLVYVKSRVGTTSLDDIVEHDGRNIAGVALSGGPDVYNLYSDGRGGAMGAARTAGGWNTPATVLHNSGVSRNLDTNLLDNAIRSCRANGGDPDVIVMGYDQLDRLNSILQARQRFLETGEFVVKVGDDSTLPGSHGGFQLATYKSIPIFVDVDTPRSVSSTGTLLGSNVYVLDTRYLEIAIAAPTQYMDNRDFFQANAYALRGMFYTILELRATRFDVHAKITDLAA